MFIFSLDSPNLQEYSKKVLLIKYKKGWHVNKMYLLQFAFRIKDTSYTLRPKYTSPLHLN